MLPSRAAEEVGPDDVTILRMAQARRVQEVDYLIENANPESMGIDIIIKLLAMLYVRG